MSGVKLAGAVMVAALAAACSSGPANAPLTGTSAGNALVCRHYLAQRNWLKSLTQPTLAAAQQFYLDISVDEGQATGRLYRDLLAMVKNAGTKGNAYYAASVRVYQDCT